MLRVVLVWVLVWVWVNLPRLPVGRGGGAEGQTEVVTTKTVMMAVATAVARAVEMVEKAVRRVWMVWVM